jgi:N-methylhydantoinase A/oxoprolinase/acetone carboxylase beta subunit
MKKYYIGIDTGGTYTDAVLIDGADGQILATAKEPTTHYRLSLGIENALKSLLEKAAVKTEQVVSVAVSSTLATNSVVENKGARVALLVIGYVKHFKLPVKAVAYIKGGHTIKGEEEEPLDLEYLVDIVNGLKNEVDAYGVCSAMSIENPTHELVAEKAISLIDPKPVFCSHRISNLAGMQQRAGTAALHAKLMPIMQDFVAGVKEAMADQGLRCPMAIIGGNAKVVPSTDAVEQAGVTVASGPACTASFGSLHTETDSLIIDVGGTTTDIAMIENAKPLISRDGCTIGDWKTHIEAVDMHTGGIGGDSLICINHDKSMTIGPARVAPLAMAAGFSNPLQWIGPSTNARCIRLISNAEKIEVLSPSLQSILTAGPATLERLRQTTGLSGIPLEALLEQLSRKQAILETGFTPTDALHVLGKINLGDKEKSVEGATVLGALLGKTPEEFSRMVIHRTEEKIENLILEYIFNRYWGKTLANFISTHNSHPVLQVDFSVKVPLIGIGAAARFFLPKIAARLSTTVTFPEHFEVGNAIGAAMIGRTTADSQQ